MNQKARREEQGTVNEGRITKRKSINPPFRKGTGGILSPSVAKWPMLLLIFLTVSALLPFLECNAQEARKPDLSATLKYVRNWAARDAFPDSPSFAYENVYCQLALQKKVSNADKNRIIEFLKKCQKPGGGFVSNPALNERPNAIFTYYALSALDLIGAPQVIDRPKAAGFILSLVQPDGGIKATASDRRANLGTTFYGVRSLALLKALDRIDKSRAIAYVKSHRDASKGFGVLPGKPSAVQATFMAVDCLKLLGGLTDDVKPGVIGFIRQSPYSGLNKPANLALMNIDDEAYVLGTAAMLSAVPKMNEEKIHEFVESLYIPHNGGFGPSPELGSTPPSTYSAIVCMVKLGKLKDPHSMRR